MREKNETGFTLVRSFIGLGEFVTLQCPQSDERWWQRAGPVESPLLTGPEWRKGEGLKEGPQVNLNRFTLCSIADLFHVSLVWNIRPAQH